MLAWLVLAVVCLSVCDSLCDLVLWAQEGALGEVEQLEQQRQKAGSLSAKPSRQPYTVEEPTARMKKSRWGNMNWFALYLVLAGPTTYFVFRGAAR